MLPFARGWAIGTILFNTPLLLTGQANPMGVMVNGALGITLLTIALIRKNNETIR